MKRHGQDEIGFLNHGSSDPLQPAREARHEIEAIGVLEREYRSLAGVVVPHDRARLVEVRRLRVARGALRLFEHRHLKRDAATGAGRAFDKADSAPAPRAKTSCLADMLAALKA